MIAVDSSDSGTYTAAGKAVELAKILGSGQTGEERGCNGESLHREVSV